MELIKAEYIWLDGATPTQTLRSKTRLVPVEGEVSLESFPEWSFDGSSTYQSPGGDSDLGLKPVFFCADPTRLGGYLVLTEVLNADGSPHESNHRAELRRVLDAGGAKAEAWIGFEQEYTLFQEGRPLGFPANGYPAPQGPFYCGVGADRVFGREIAEDHIDACMEAGIMLYGINAEVMPGQWEFQIGYRGIDSESADVLNVSDHLWIARWLMQRIAEDADVVASFDNKPMKGD
ncbi:MAG: glutamine synthetase, partial [Myxococcota bacterium]